VALGTNPHSEGYFAAQSWQTRDSGTDATLEWPQCGKERPARGIFVDAANIRVGCKLWVTAPQGLRLRLVRGWASLATASARCSGQQGRDGARPGNAHFNGSE
jgi:hypothetical protein